MQLVLRMGSDNGFHRQQEVRATVLLCAEFLSDVRAGGIRRIEELPWRQVSGQLLW